MGDQDAHREEERARACAVSRSASFSGALDRLVRAIFVQKVSEIGG